MLKQRVITALVLLAILLPALFAAQPEWFMAVALVLLVLGAWEWGQLNGYSKKSSWLIALDCLVLCAVVWKTGLPYRPTPVLWIIVGSAWVLLGAWLLQRGVTGWPLTHRWIRVVGGVLVLAVAWLAVAQARVTGTMFLLSILLLVWAADIGAYFAGRRFGKRKLALSISPGKSWEGVWGGILAALVVAFALWYFDVLQGLQGSSSVTLLGMISRAHGFVIVLLTPIFLVAMSVVGDLVESLVKRSTGAKDSSNLLPGHGGILDRVDALLPTLPLAMMLASL
jgi:phosphatidate cytidylyltransferase